MTPVCGLAPRLRARLLVIPLSSALTCIAAAIGAGGGSIDPSSAPAGRAVHGHGEEPEATSVGAGISESSAADAARTARTADRSTTRRRGAGEPGASPGPGSAASGAPPSGGAPEGLFRGRVLTRAGKSFDVEVVEDEPSRERGLQQRSRLDAGEGMLFVFPSPGRHQFWMYRCLIPLDILWIGADRRVIDIRPNLPVCGELPCPGYGPDADSLYVLELAAGVAGRSGIRVGERLEIHFARPPNPS